mmetsp:Transcript_10732/g.31293  ORF Transcript_10732/g.31293 Transcript_10732/m.31293 type:complete len:459 (+) Transcript_10732:2-1378(+)
MMTAVWIDDDEKKNTKGTGTCQSKEVVDGPSPSPLLSKRTQTSEGTIVFVPITICSLLLFLAFFNDGVPAASAFSLTTITAGKTKATKLSKHPEDRIWTTSLRSASVSSLFSTKKFDAKSCPPPRFDDFSEQLIGKWISQNDAADTANNNESGNENDDNNALRRVVEVEEVMRSCGGAVQGIREPAIQIDFVDGDSVYLNRANDGFFFFNDGSYSMGPIMISEDDSDDPNGFLSCLMLPALLNDEWPPHPKRRMVVASFANHDTIVPRNYECSFSQIQPYRAAIRMKAKFGDDASSATAEVLDGEKVSRTEEDSHRIPMVDNVTTVIRCRMPSESQPWMLQRAKWENLSPAFSSEDTDAALKDDDDVNGKEESADEVAASLRHWVVSESEAEFYHRIGIETESTAESADETTAIIHCGVACLATNSLRLVARKYASKGGHNNSLHLRAILYVAGTIRR